MNKKRKIKNFCRTPHRPAGRAASSSGGLKPPVLEPDLPTGRKTERQCQPYQSLIPQQARHRETGPEQGCPEQIHRKSLPRHPSVPDPASARPSRRGPHHTGLTNSRNPFRRHSPRLKTKRKTSQKANRHPMKATPRRRQVPHSSAPEARNSGCHPTYKPPPASPCDASSAVHHRDRATKLNPSIQPTTAPVANPETTSNQHALPRQGRPHHID